VLGKSTEKPAEKYFVKAYDFEDCANHRKRIICLPRINLKMNSYE